MRRRSAPSFLRLGNDSSSESALAQATKLLSIGTACADNRHVQLIGKTGCALAIVAVGAVLLVGCGGKSSAEQSVLVPDLVGMKSVKATQRIYDSGLCLHDIRFGTFNGRHNEVLDQSPPAGASVAGGTSVTITVTPAGLSGSIYAFDPFNGCERPLTGPIG